MRKIEILIDGAQGTRCKVGDILTIDTINEATETIHTKAGGGYPGYLFDTFKEGEYFRFVDSDDYWKVGQKVRCIKQYGGSFKVGKIYTINVSQHSPNGQCNKNWNTVSENGSREGYIINNKPVRDCFELVTEEDEVKLKDVELKVKEQKVSKSADEIVQGIHAGLGGLVDSVLAESKTKVEKEMKAFKTEIKGQFEDLTKNMPIMQIKLGETGEIKKLKQKANQLLPRVITNAKLGLYTMLVGPAGCGKTTLANQLAEALDVQFGAVCLTAGASETWLFGRQTATGFVEGPFAKLYKEGGVFLADEMDAADANLLLSMNTALSHDVFINPMNGEVMKKHKDFVFIGAANTNGKGANHVYTGRTRLDAATLDRFIILEMNYDNTLEKSLCPDDMLRKYLDRTREGLQSKQLDDFISTRAYKNLYLMHEAGIPYRDLMESLISNWGEASKKIARDYFNKCIDERNEKLPEDGIMKVLAKEVLPPAKKRRKKKARKVVEDKAVEESDEIPF